jgi:dihydroneopterin aldolase
VSADAVAGDAAGARLPAHGGGDCIQLRGMRFLGCHGADPRERSQGQPFEVDLDLFGDLSLAGRTDELAATVDYGQLCEVVRSVVEGPQVQLLERLAELVAEGALAAAGPVATAAVVTVRKLRPPVACDLVSAGVKVTRSRPGAP